MVSFKAVVKYLEKKKKGPSSTWNSISSETILHSKGEIDLFRHVKAERIYYHSRLAVEEMLKEVLWSEGRWFQMGLCICIRNEERWKC